MMCAVHGLYPIIGTFMTIVITQQHCTDFCDSCLRSHALASEVGCGVWRGARRTCWRDHFGLFH